MDNALWGITVVGLGILFGWLATVLAPLLPL